MGATDAGPPERPEADSLAGSLRIPPSDDDPRLDTVQQTTPGQGDERTAPDDDPLEGVVERLGENPKQPVERGELREVIQAFRYSEEHRGPLPPPHQLRQYAALIPNGAERIMRGAEEERWFRHGIVEKQQANDYDLAKRGQQYGLGVTGMVMVVALIFAFLGEPALATVVLGLDLVALVAVFVTGNYRRKKGRERREQEESEQDEG